MKTTISKAAILQIIIVFAICSGLIFNLSCKKEDKEPDFQNTGILTYSGSVTIAQGASVVLDTLDFSFTEGSSNKGTFFRRSDGEVGVFSGTVSGSKISLKGWMKSDTTLLFSGTVQVVNSNLSIDIVGNDRSGNYTCRGKLSQENCLDIAGNYDVQESTVITITMQGESDSQSQSGTGTVVMNQAECQVSYVITGTTAGRSGGLNGNKLTLTGEFVILAGEGITLTENSVTGDVTIIDNYHFEFVGTGFAKGSFEGVPFEIKGSSTGVFDRNFSGPVTSPAAVPAKMDILSTLKKMHSGRVGESGKSQN